MLISVYLEIVLILTRDRCTICAERTTGQKSFWIHQIEHHGDVGHVDSHFGPFKDNVTIGPNQVHGLR
jgi:hypothetical protein